MQELSNMARALNILLICASLPLLASAFYLPGVAPRAFKDGESVNLKVQTVTTTPTSSVCGVKYGSVGSRYFNLCESTSPIEP